MTKTLSFGLWFCLLAVLVWPGPAPVPGPAQCLVSGMFNLIRLPQCEDAWRCWKDCFEQADCHMAVVVSTLSGSDQCLLLNCLNQSRHSYPRDLREQIMVYPKSTIDDGKTGSYFLQQRNQGLIFKSFIEVF